MLTLRSRNSINVTVKQFSYKRGHTIISLSQWTVACQQPGVHSISALWETNDSLPRIQADLSVSLQLLSAESRIYIWSSAWGLYIIILYNPPIIAFYMALIHMAGCLPNSCNMCKGLDRGNVTCCAVGKSNLYIKNNYF